MRCGFISDIHIDINKEYPVLENLVAISKEKKCDILIVAGDIAEDYRKTIAAMDLLNESIPSWFVPGNHDLWVPEGSSLTSKEIYDILSEDEHCLIGHPLVLEEADTLIVGDTGWYDYSLAGNHPLHLFEGMKFNGRVWQDSIRNRSFTSDNRATCEWMLSKLGFQLSGRWNYSNRIAVTHMIPIKEFRVPADWKDWSFFNAFLGSSEFGELFEREGVTLSVSGHVHFRKQFEHGGTTYICPCLGYEREWKLTGKDPHDVRVQIEDSLVVKTIGRAECSLGEKR